MIFFPKLVNYLFVEKSSRLKIPFLFLNYLKFQNKSIYFKFEKIMKSHPPHS